MERRRVVVTGMGTVNPLAHNVSETWKAIQKGRSGVSHITAFDTSDYSCKVAGEVKDFDPTVWMPRKDARKMARFCQFAVAGAVQAVEDSGIDSEELNRDRVAVILGNGIGGHEVSELALSNLLVKGPKGISPMTIPKLIMNEGPANVSIRYGFNGPSLAVCTACTSATDALGNSLNAIRYNNADVVVSGGMEAAITPFGVAGFIQLTALSSKYNDNPVIASRPFDKDRDGFVMGEGSGVLVLEELEHARKRGAKIYAEIVGYGITCDAYHLTSPDSTGEGPARCMALALEDAGMRPSDIDYLNAHGTSTPTNDPLETLAIKKAFGDFAYSLPISSTKSMTAHMVGGAGGIEAIISILAMRDGYIPPTVNLDEPDPECNLDYVPHKGRKKELEVVMSQNLGFGGHNGALIFRKFKE